MKKKIVKTKKGHFADWEGGGGMTNTGNAEIVCNSDGSSKCPIYVRTGGHLSNGHHALFIVKEGDVSIRIDRHSSEYRIKIYKYLSFSEEDEQCFAELELVWQNDGYESEIPAVYQNAVEVGMKKSRDYHCRIPYYTTTTKESLGEMI